MTNKHPYTGFPYGSPNFVIFPEVAKHRFVLDFAMSSVYIYGLLCFR